MYCNNAGRPDTNNDRGVGEKVNLGLAGSPAGSFFWSTSDQGTYGSVLSSAWGTSNIVFTAGCISNIVTVSVNPANSGPLCPLQFTVLAPQSESAVINQSNLLSYPDGQPMPNGMQGAGYCAWRLPSTQVAVSFTNVQCQEQSCSPTSVEGYFQGKAGSLSTRSVDHVG